MMSIVTKFSVTSPEVTEAKLGKFRTVVQSVTVVNGSKYRPGDWSQDMFEVETEDGVYISRTNFTDKIGKQIEVRINPNNPDITWLWINLVSGAPITSEPHNTEEPIFIKLEDALKRKIPAKSCYVYKLEIGPEIYIGFTSKDPRQRIEEHIDRSRNNAGQDVNMALRKWGYQHTWEIIGAYENEILALLAEKTQIVKLKATLNQSGGGEGDDFNIVEQRCEISENVFENIFYVHDKRGILKD